MDSLQGKFKITEEAHVFEIELDTSWFEVKHGKSSLHLKWLNGNPGALSNLKRTEFLFLELNKFKNENKVVEYLIGDEFFDLSVVYKNEDIFIIKSDIVRSSPLFYSIDHGRVSITDHVKYQNRNQIDRNGVTEFVANGYVSGGDTFYKNIYSLQAAEIISFTDEDIRSHRYFSYDIDSTADITDTSNLKETACKLDNLLKDIFQKIINSIESGGRIVVPLSGGHDSRIVVNYLYKLGFKNVICFSYGISGNIQSEISRKVAKVLGFEWHFIEYTDQKWSELHENGTFKKYIEFANRGVSNPHLQDFLAVHELKKRKILHSSDVFVPGHGLDLLANVVDHSIYKDIDIVSAALKRFGWDGTNIMKNNNPIYKKTEKIYKKSGVSRAAFLDYLLWQERQSKFTINSFRTYEYFGFQGRAPFWDIRLVRFWLAIDRELKFSRKYLFEMEKAELLTRELRAIPYADTRRINNYKKRNLKRYIPPLFALLFLRLTKRKKNVNEGLSHIYSMKKETIEEFVSPIHLWPDEAISIFKKRLKRYPYQINYHFFTRLYTLVKCLKKDNL